MRTKLRERLTRTVDTGTREVQVPLDSLGRERWRATLDKRVIERRDDSTEVDFHGHAIVFDKRTWIGPKKWGFWEQVSATSVDKTLDEADVRFLQNHNPDLLLARNKAGTLDLGKDKVGLTTDARMDTRQSYANDVTISLERGDISQMSFAFETIKDSWETLDDGSELRTLEEIRLWDVSVVTYPAYEDTDAGLRGVAFDMMTRAAGLDDVATTKLLRGLTVDEDDDESLLTMLREAGATLASLDLSEPGLPTRVDSQPAESTGRPLALMQRRHRLNASRFSLG